MKPKRRGLGALIAGLLLMFVAAPALFGGGVWYGAKHLKSVADDSVAVAKGASIKLDANEKALVMVDTGASSSSGFSVESNSGSTSQQCTVASPDGASLTSTENNNVTVHYDGRTYQSAGVFTATSAGDYAIDCAEGPTRVVTGDAAGSLVGNTVLPMAIGLVLSVVVGLLGLILTIVGIVKLVRSGRPQNPYGGPPPAYGTGYGQPGQPQYGQQQYGQPQYGQQQYGQPQYGQQPGSVPPPPGGATAQPDYRPPAQSQSYPPPPVNQSGTTQPIPSAPTDPTAPPPPPASGESYPPRTN